MIADGHVEGGTNVSFSPSYEYVDQVLLPSLERYGIKVSSTLEKRGWSTGYRQIGAVSFKIHPLAPGQGLRNPEWPKTQGRIVRIDVSLVTPTFLHEPLRSTLLFELDLVFPGVDIDFKLIEESRHGSRIYLLLVAHTETGLRFGRDWLYDEKSKGKDSDEMSTRIAQKVVDELDQDIRKRKLVDEYLEDQLIIFQALAGGTSSVSDTADGDSERVERTDQPFGVGSLHTTTARWVVSQMLPNVIWKDGGRVCEGIGWRKES